MIARILTVFVLAASLQFGGDERLAYFDNVLAPKAGAAIDAPAQLQARKPKDVAEAKAAYDRGLVFVSQGAWKEAEKDLRTAEKKTSDEVPDYVFAAAYAYLKLHRGGDALKRYEKI